VAGLIPSVDEDSIKINALNYIVTPQLEMRVCDWWKSRHVAVNKSR